MGGPAAGCNGTGQAARAGWRVIRLSRRRLGPTLKTKGEILSEQSDAYQRRETVRLLEELRSTELARSAEWQASLASHPGFQTLTLDPEWIRIEAEWNEVIEKDKQERAFAEGRWPDELTEAEKAKVKTLDDALNDRLFPLKWASIKLRDAYGIPAVMPDRAADPPPSAAPPEQGEAKAGAGAIPGQPAITSGAAREAAWCKLEPAVRKAYLAFQYVACQVEKRPEDLEDRDAHDWLKEHGINPDKGDLDDLTDYKPPKSLDTFRRYLSTARDALGENKYTPRAGRSRGPSVARGDEIEYQKGVEE
jgi:hypothetical protein